MLLSYFISNFITALLNLFLGIFVYLKNRKNKINITFALMNISVAVWAFGFAMAIIAPNKDWGFFWVRVLNIGSILIPVFFLHFVFSLLNLDKRKRITLIIAYTISFFILILSFSPLYNVDVTPKLSFRYYSVPGSLYFLYILMLISYMAYGTYKLIKEFETATGSYRNQIKYVIIACLVGSSGGMTTFLPVFNINVYPFGIPFFPLEAIIISYAIVKHRLMDIDFVLKKGAVYLYASSLFLVPLIAVVIIAELIIYKDINLPFSILSILVISLAAYVFPKVRLHAERTTEQYIFKNLYDYKAAIADLSKAMVTILNMDELCKKIINTTTEAMDVNKASVFIIDEDRDRYVLCDSRGVTIGFGHVVDSFRRDDPFFKAVEQHNKIIIREEVESFKDLSDSQLIIQVMNDMESELCIPLIAKSKLVGIINLGMKGNKRMYSHEDIEMLTTLANSATIAIENAQLIENIKKTKKVMARADRLAGIGQLAAGIAHEIRNPLVAIKTSAQLLPDRYNDEEFRTYFSTIVASEIERATKKINDLLDYARPSAPFFQQENLNEIIEGMVAFVKNDAYKKEQTIEINLSQELPTITVDKQQMKQVFINLLFNAIQSTPEKGKISITTKKRTKSNGPTDFIQVEVSDTGVGIPEEDLEKIFTPFFTTKAKEEGSGLGLAMTHQIIEEHEGTIDVQSRINQGTTFTINLPVNPLIFKQNKDDARSLH